MVTFHDDMVTYLLEIVRYHDMFDMVDMVDMVVGNLLDESSDKSHLDRVWAEPTRRECESKLDTFCQRQQMLEAGRFPP